MTPLSSRTTHTALAAVLALALVVRLYGLTYGLPYLYNADENTTIFRALGMGTGDLNPHDFLWPGSPLFYLAFFLFGIYYVLGNLIGLFHSTQDFALHVVQDPSALVILVRGLVAFSGIISVLLSYFLGRHLFGRSGIGLLSALLTAVIPIHVERSQTALPDIPMLASVQLFLLCCFFVSSSGNWRYYLAAGAMAGLAVAFKYSAAAVTPVLLAASLIRPGIESLRQRVFNPLLLMGAVASAISFVILTPFSLLSFHEFTRDISYHSSYIFGGGQPWARPPIPTFLYLFLDTIPQTSGTLLTIFSILGLFYAIYRRTSADILLLVGFLSLYIFTARANTVFAQYAIPFIPFLTLLTARMVIEVTDRVVTLPHGRYIPAAFVIVALVAQPFAQVARHDYSLTQVDTRTEAKVWIEANIPAGAKVMMDGGRDLFTVSPPLRYSRAGVERRIREARRDEPGRVRYWETLLQTTGNGGYDLYPIQGDMFHRSVPQLREEGFQYVVLSSDILNSIVTGKALQWDPQADVLYRSLQQDATLLKTFTPGPLQPGPALWVYQITR